MADERLPDFPVIVIHLEDPPGSGLATCCGRPFTPPNGFPKTPRWLCTGCARRAPLREIATDRAGEYGRLLADRDRLIADGADPDELAMPDRP